MNLFFSFARIIVSSLAMRDWDRIYRTRKDDSLNLEHPLLVLHNRKIDGFRLYAKEILQLKRSGWRGFKLYLQNLDGQLSDQPVIKGIYSAGGKDGVRPWLDIDYRGSHEFLSTQNLAKNLKLSSKRLDQEIFKLIGSIIPPGGHLMVSYEGQENIHLETASSLSIGIPPCLTPLGFLIFRAGFTSIKDWYIAEGGYEGPRKLWGEKAPDRKWGQIFCKKTKAQIKEFLSQSPGERLRELEDSARKRAFLVLKMIGKNK